MMLATRCPSCATVFRVVQDQLRVSQGWVRCGRCSEAFNAIEAMVDPSAAGAAGAAERAAAEAVAAGPVDGTADADAAGTADAAEPAEAADAAQPAEAAETAEADFAAAVSAAQAGAETPAPALIELPPGIELIASDGAVTAEALYGSAAADTGEVAAAPAAADAAGAADLTEPPLTAGPAGVGDGDRVEPDFGFSTAAATTDAPLPAPSFVLQADRAARWRRPGVRAALGLVALVAALGLAAQALYVWRDRIAATDPAWRNTLQQACASLGCRVGEFRQLDALSVESSALVRVEGAPIYRLAITLRNRAALEVAAPAIELAITDAQGRTLARRVLTMAALELPLRSLKPGSELPIQVPLAIADRQVSGYTVEIFYP